MKPLLASLLSLALLCAFAASPKHDVHVSYCKAEMTATSFKAKVTYYKDDFFKALAAAEGREVRGLPPERMKAIYARYVESHFKLTSRGAVVPWKWIIRGEDGTSILFELRAEFSAPIADAAIEHTALFQEYGDQMNLMVLKAPGAEYNFIFTPSKPGAALAS
jgi:hypothetical protein